MPDQLTDDNLADLFAELRTEALPQVTPPGTAAARATVRRRRATTSIAAGVAVLAVAGGVSAAVLNPETTRTGGSAHPEPTYDSSQLASARRLVAMHLAVGGSAPAAGGIDSMSGIHAYTHRVLGGTYDLSMTCNGRGDVTVSTWTTAAEPADAAAPTNLANHNVSCGDAANVQRATVQVPGPVGILNVQATPDDDARGRSVFGFAPMLSRPDQEFQEARAQTLLAAKPDEDRVFGTATFLRGPHDFEYDGLGPGRYRVRAACSGAGMLWLGVREKGAGRKTLAQRIITCSDASATKSMAYKSPPLVTVAFTTHRTGQVEIHISPDLNATGQAATAYELDRG